ncbi:MAG: hypothetical protein AB1Z98_32455 [Nannocystaceae bacterium]
MASRSSILCPLGLTLTLAATMLGCPSDPADPTPTPNPGTECEQAAAHLESCGETVPAGFVSSCESNIGSARSCNDDCGASVVGCYSTPECRTAAEVDSCVGSALNFESCLCDDPSTYGSDTDTDGPDATTTTGAEDSTGTTSGEATLCEQSYADLLACGKAPGLDFIDGCEADLAFGEGCHPDCATQISGCYSVDPSCETVAEVLSCVSNAINFEACLCDDTAGATGTGSTG